MKAKQLSTTSISTACLRSMLPFPLRPRGQRPDPPLAEVQVAEEERLLDRGGRFSRFRIWVIRARVTPSCRGLSVLARDGAVFGQPRRFE